MILSLILNYYVKFVKVEMGEWYCSSDWWALDKDSQKKDHTDIIRALLEFKRLNT